MIKQSQTECFWEVVKSNLEGIFPKDIYETWFKPLKLNKKDDSKVIISVPNDFAAIWIEENYNDIILKHIQMALGCSMKVEYIVDVEIDRVEPEVSHPENRFNSFKLDTEVEVPQKKRKPVKENKVENKYHLNPKNTFNNFVVGSGNQLAHAASIAVANAPAKAYNPLFMYGSTGLGKTHLMQAIAHLILETKPDYNVAYISTEKFTNEFIHAIQENTLTQFRRRYRNVDVLLIDDIHFLSGKERIQEEFFHTFNELFENQNQIVLCSDRPAGEIAQLESRLVSRFQWGLVTDIQAPDYETRLAILSKKAQGLDIPDEILSFLAERVSKNIRRLEGALTRIAGFSALVYKKIDKNTVEKLLADILEEEVQNQVTIEKVQKRVSEHFNLKASDMLSKKRPSHIAFPRQIAMYLSRILTNSCLKDIGKEFGGRDHGTVIHACKAVENMMDQDSSIRHNVEYLKKQLLNR